jgi:hypothetical protein
VQEFINNRLQKGVDIQKDFVIDYQMEIMRTRMIPVPLSF